MSEKFVREMCEFCAGGRLVQGPPYMGGWLPVFLLHALRTVKADMLNK